MRSVSTQFAGGCSPLGVTKDTVQVCACVFGCLGVCVHALDETAFVAWVRIDERWCPPLY